MGKLIINRSADFSGLLLLDIDTIEFNAPANATFLSIQFGSNRIDDDVQIGGSSGVNRIIVDCGIGGFDASGWTFSFWQQQDRVVVNGSSWGEELTGTSRNDRLNGDGGSDTITGGGGSDVISGGAGADRLSGGAGFDTLSYEGSEAGVKVNLAKNEASRGEAQGDSISGFENVTGSEGADILEGNAASNRLTGGGGSDRLDGGGGADRFVYRHVSDSTPDAPDVISDFGSNDLINLSAIDARYVGRDNAFRFIGMEDFEQAGDLRYWTGFRDTIIQADTDGDGVADLEIILSGRIDLSASDFIL